MATKIEQDDWSPPPMTIEPKCALSGEAAPDLRDPLIAYAREHLVSEIEQRGFRGLPVIVAGESKPKTCYTQIRVDPRTQTGELEVTQCEPDATGRCEWGASIHYCLHVTNSRGVRTIVVEPHAEMLGARVLSVRRLAAISFPETRSNGHSYAHSYAFVPNPFGDGK